MEDIEQQKEILALLMRKGWWLRGRVSVPSYFVADAPHQTIMCRDFDESDRALFASEYVDCGSYRDRFLFYALSGDESDSNMVPVS